VSDGSRDHQLVMMDEEPITEVTVTVTLSGAVQLLQLPES